MMSKVWNATTAQEFRAGIIEELRFRAWQERASARIRPSKPKFAQHEHAAVALENLANDIEREILTLEDLINAGEGGL